jgi:hypothetical protein
LLSDGEFSKLTVEYLKAANPPIDEHGKKRRQIAVHTILFHKISARARGIMKEIARENAGKYLFVPAN